MGATAFCLQFYLVTNETIDSKLLCFIFSSTVLTYTFQRYAKLNSGTYSKSDRMIWMKNHPRLVQFILLSSMLVTLFIGVSFPLSAVAFLGIMGAISFFYIRKFPGENSRNLRDRPYLKIYLIAGVWALTSVLLPILLLEDYQANYLLLIAANFAFILAITIPFDIRDLELDEKEKKTIPQITGIIGSKILAIISCLISATLIVFLNFELWVPLGICGLFTIGLIIGSGTKRKDHFYSFLVDGLLVLQAVLIWLFLLLSINETIPYAQHDASEIIEHESVHIP